MTLKVMTRGGMGKGQLIFVRTPLGFSVVTENPRGGDR